MAENDALSTLTSSAALVIIGGVFSAAGTLLERVIIGNILSPAAYGEVSIALTIMSVSVTVCLLGLSQGIPRYISRFEATEKKRGVWVSGILVSFFAALVVAVLLYLNADFLATHLFERANATRLVRLFAVALPCVTGLLIGVSGVRGMENTIYKTYTKDLLYPFFRIVLVTVLLIFGFGVMAAGYAYIVAAAISFVVAHLLLNNLFPLIGRFELRVRELMRFSLPLVIATLLASLLLRTDTVMLGYFRESFEVGQYSAAYPLGRGMLILLSSFGFMYLPLASSLDAEGKRDEIDAIYATTTKWVYIGTFPAFVTMVFFSEDLLRIFFGAKYTPGGIALTILAVGFFSNAIGGRNRETLSALGHTRYVLLSNSIAFVLNITLNLVLIPRYGFVGAAVASAMSIIFLNIFVCAILAFKFNISPFSRWSVRTYVTLPLVLLAPFYVASQYLALNAVLLLPFLLCVGVLALVTVGAVGGFQPEDQVVIDLIESKTGVQIPFVRQYLPGE